MDKQHQRKGEKSNIQIGKEFEEKALYKTIGDNMKKLVISLILFTLLIGCNEENRGPSIWNGGTDTKWYEESKNEFTITTAEQLVGFAKLVNDGNDFKGKIVKLGQNIILNDTANWQNWTGNKPTNEWIPIGNNDNQFRGIFDGNGYVVSGVYINNSDNFQGFFGRIASGTIKNFGIVASYIKGGGDTGGLVGYNNSSGTISNSYYTGIVEGTRAIGGLVGYNNGEITGSYSSCTVIGDTLVGGLVGVNESSNISDSYSIGEVTGKLQIGGLVGRNESGKISDSYSTSKIAGESHVGGLVGTNWNGTISNGYSTGTVMGNRGIGGLVGGNENGKINGCYSIGMITGEKFVGGLVGANNNNSEIRNSYSTGSVTGEYGVGGLAGGTIGGKIEYSYSVSTVTGQSYTGGLIGGNEGGKINNCYYNKETSGRNNSEGGTGKTTMQMKETITFANWNFTNTWSIKSTINEGYPHLLKNKGKL